MSDTLDTIRSLLIHDAKKSRLILDMNKLRELNPQAALETTKSPLEILPTLEEQTSTKIGISGHLGEYSLTPRTIKSEFLSSIISIEGIVVSISLVHPKLKKSVHYSNEARSFYEKDYRDSTMITRLPPTSTVYPTSNAAGPLQFEFGLSEFVDFQTIILQELIEQSPKGQLPRTVEVVLSDDLVDQIKPGERVRIYGVYKAIGSIKTAFQGNKMGRFRTVIIANNIEKKKADEVDINEPVFVVENPFTIPEIVKFIAPSIFGHEKIKMALALLLAGGTEIVRKNGSKTRGDINILLVGDPGLAKSQLLRFVSSVAPLCVSTTGRGSSVAGLTAAVVMDRETSTKKLEAGAMVLADGGIIAIDEFDKMTDEDRVALHEAMEQQTVTIAKAGIHCTLNARCSVLAAANPIKGKFDFRMSISDNISMPESLLSRFDLIFIVLDNLNEEQDQKIASHVVENHFKQKESSFISKYFEEAKKRKPVLTKDAIDLIASSFVEIRQIKGSLSVTPRMLESIVRISTALAKLRLSNEVDQKDVEEAVSLLKETLFNIQNIKPSSTTNNFEQKRIKIEHVEPENEDEDPIISLLWKYHEEHPEVENLHIEIFYEIAAKDGFRREDVLRVVEGLHEIDAILFYENSIFFL